MPFFFYFCNRYKDKEITISTQHEKIQTFIARIDVCSILAVEGRRRYVAVATDARAASGATAAPTFALPRAMMCYEPPRMIPSFMCPVTKPINVHATRG